MKDRDQVRDETQRAFRIVGYVLLALSFVGLAVYTVAPVIADVNPPSWYVAVASGMLALGIAMAFPRSMLGHYIVGHVDAALDRWIGPDQEEGES